MTATVLLTGDKVFHEVPVKGTVRGFSIDRPPILRTSPITGIENHNDKEWDARAASLNQKPKTYYLANIAYSPKGKNGVTKTVVSITEVDQATWLTRRREWSQWLNDNAADFTNTYPRVIANLGTAFKAPISRTVHAATVPTVVTPVPTPVVSMNGPLPSKTWDPNDEDIAHDLYDVPNDNPNFQPDQELFQILDTAWKQALESDEPRQILIYGDTSTGKTESPIIWAARNDVLHCRIDCGAFGEIYDVTGPIKAVERNGSSITEWTKGKTIRAMADPRPAVIQLDEVNRISDVKAMNVLFPFFDSSRQSYFDDNQTWMKLNGVKLIICTMNGDTRGDDIGEYVGTQPLDQAFISRFPIRRQLRYPDAVKLAQILQSRNGGVLPDATLQTLAEIAVELVALNKFVPNFRELFAAMDFLKSGTDLFHALKWTVGGIYKDDGTAASDYVSFKAVLIGKGINTDETP